MDIPSGNERLLNELNGHKIIEFSPAIVYVVIVMVFGIFGNLFAIVYYGFKANKTTTNVLITALATTDLVTCIVYCGEIIELCNTLTFRNAIGCKIMYFMNHWLVYASGCVLLLIGVDRYRMICKRKFWQVSIQAAKFAITAVVIFCGLLSVKDFYVFDIVPVNLTVSDNNKSILGFYCSQSKDAGMESFVFGSQFIDLFVFLIIIVSLIILYTFVSREVWKYRIKSRTSKITSVTSNTSSMNPEIASISSCTLAETNVSEQTETDVTNGHNEVECRKVNKNPTIETVSQTSEMNSEVGGSCGDNTEETNANDGNGISKSKTLKRVRKKRSRKLERKIAVMMIATTAASIISFVPHFILNLVVKSTSDTHDHQEFNVGLQIVWRSFLLNSAINPYIMGFFNTQFRRYFKYLVFKCRPLNMLR